MTMVKFFLLFSVIILSNSLEQQNPIEIEDKISLQEIKFDNYIDKKTAVINKMKELLSSYLASRNWTENKKLDDYTFIRIFIYVTSHSLFKKSTREQLNALAEKMMSLHEGPIIVKDLKKFFDYDELLAVYQGLFGKKNLDL